MNVSLRDLNVIEACDPDGGSVEPTDTDYAIHQAWAVAQFGQATWDVYARGGYNDETTDADDFYTYNSH